jgi:hypothetical protein
MEAKSDAFSILVGKLEEKKTTRQTKTPVGG